MFCAPAMDSIDLIACDDEWGTCFFQGLQTFDGLWLEAFHHIDHQHGNVSNRPASVSQTDKRMVARRINEQQSGRFEFLATHHGGTCFVEDICGNFSCSDMLSDAPCFTIHHACLAFTANGANQIQHAGLTMIDVAEHRNDWLAVVAAFCDGFFRRIRFGFVHDFTSAPLWGCTHS